MVLEELLANFQSLTLFFFNLAISIKKTHKNIKKIIIGKDTRKSCDDIEAAIILGFESEKVKCDSCGIVSTPNLSFNTRNFDYDLGIMISASHNSFSDNGIKIFKNNGEKLSDNDEIEIEKNLEFKDKKLSIKKNIKNNMIVIKNYEDELLKDFSRLNNFKQKIFIDCANGSLSKIAPRVLEKLNLNFIKYGCEPNGKNINYNCGAMYPKKLSINTLTSNSDIGISFDGDADRVLFCDETGKIIDGDYILAILSKNLKSNKSLINNLVITTKMSNLGFRNFLENNDINFMLCDVGDRYVIEKMRENKSIIGGEQSGHIILAENSYCGDGLLTALQILDILNERKFKLSQLCSNLFKKSPQKLVNIKLKKNPSHILENSIIKNYLSKESVSKNCDVLLRKSGTENLLRLMVQSPLKSEMEKTLEDLVNIINEIDENTKN